MPANTDRITRLTTRSTAVITSPTAAGKPTMGDEDRRDRLAGAEAGREESDRGGADRRDHEHGRLRVRDVEAQRGGDEEQAKRLHEHEPALDREELERARDARAGLERSARACTIAIASSTIPIASATSANAGMREHLRDAAEHARGADPRDADDRGEVQPARHLHAALVAGWRAARRPRPEPAAGSRPSP